MKNADFSERLVEAMKIRRMSAADLSRLTGIDKSAISRYRSGAYKPNQINTYLLAQSLRVSPAWLMGFDVPMSSDDDLLQILQNPSPAQLEWLEYQKKQALSDQERLLIDRYRSAGENVRRSICALLEVDYE